MVPKKVALSNNLNIPHFTDRQKKKIQGKKYNFTLFDIIHCGSIAAFVLDCEKSKTVV